MEAHNIPARNKTANRAEVAGSGRVKLEALRLRIARGRLGRGAVGDVVGCRPFRCERARERG